MGIEKKFPRCSNKIFKKMFTYLQKWKIVLKAEDVKIMEEVMRNMKCAGWRISGSKYEGLEEAWLL